jgi:hypothetical protein
MQNGRIRDLVREGSRGVESAKGFVISFLLADKADPRRYFDHPTPPLAPLWIVFGLGASYNSLGRASGKKMGLPAVRFSFCAGTPHLTIGDL